MNKLLLGMVMLPSSLWKRMGADEQQLRAILSVKLMMDDRKPVSFGRKQQQEGKPRKFMSIFSMFMFLLVGLIYLFPLMAFNDVSLALWAFFTMFLFMLTFSLLTDFSNVLVDTKDKIILLSRPINDRTLFLSRMLHIFIYLFRMVLPMSIPAWVLLGYMLGWKVALVYPFSILLMVFMALFFVNAAYMLLLKIVKPEKFKEVINYFQIVFSIILFGSYYILPRVMESALMQNLTIDFLPWIKWLPTFWLATLFNCTGAFPILPGTSWLSILAVVFPLFCLHAAVTWLAPSFIKKLSGIDVTEAAPVKMLKPGKSRLYQKLSRVMNRDSEARAGFMMAWLQTARSRSFKMRVYPTLAYVPIYFIYMFLLKGGSASRSWEELPGTKMHLGLLYMSAFVMLQAMGYVIVSDQYKAAWVYYASPTRYPGKIMGGAYKAMWVKFFLPFSLAISAFVLFVWGLPAVLDILLAMVNVTLFSLAIMRFSYRQLPFSQLEQMNNKAGKSVIRLFITFFTIGILGVAHYMAFGMWWLKIIFVLLAVALLWLFWESYTKTSWNNLEGLNEEI